MTRRIDIMEEDWDNLVVLDACRYDFFRRVVNQYLRGRLHKIRSQGSSTLEWCVKSFRDSYDDVVYVSANPFVNSRLTIGNFNARKHFFKVVDLWDWGWHNIWNTVHPKEVNQSVERLRHEYPDKRFIIHYMQPHAPFIGNRPPSGDLAGSDHTRDRVPTNARNGRSRDGVVTKRIFLRAINLMQPFFRMNDRLARRHRLLHEHLDWEVREFLNLPPASPIDEIRRSEGISGLRKAYQQNLEFVLEYVRNLRRYCSGVTVITSDHGERLGDSGGYSHYYGSTDQILLEVPWFEVESDVRIEMSLADMERARIKGRVRRLKHLKRL